MNKKKLISYTLISILFVVLALFSIENTDFLPYYITRPSMMIFLIFIYLAETNKPFKLFILCQFSAFLGEFIQFYDTKYLSLAIVFFTIGIFSFSFVIYSFIKTVKISTLLSYLIVYFTGFFVIYFLVLDSNLNKFLIILYGSTIVVFSTLILINFLKKMSKSNLILLVANFISLVTNLMLSMNVFNITNDKSFFIITTITTMIVHYLSCLGMIYKEEDVILRRINR